MTYVKPITCTFKQQYMKLGYKCLSQSEQEAGLDLVRPWDSLLQMLSITATWDKWTALFSRRAAHLTVREEGSARGLKAFGHFYEGGTWWDTGMPEMDTNFVKTQQVGLASGGGAKGFFISQTFFHTSIWCGARDNRKQRQKGSPQKGNRMEQQPLIPCPLLTNGWMHKGRFGSWATLNAELTELLDSQDSDTLRLLGW